MKIDSVSNMAYTQDISGRSPAAGAHQASQFKSEQPEIAPADNGLTGAEKAFFAKLFPGSVGQVNAQRTYSPVGINPKVDLGQIVNRKG